MGPLLSKTDSPADLRKLSVPELSQLCAEIREYMVECCAANPGHLGASLGAVEIAVAVHYVFDTPNDKLVWDVGHQAYAHKIITGRREAFRQNRKAGGISGFPRMSESPYDAFGTGHSSTSISAALGIAQAAKLSGNATQKVVAVIGDGSMTGGMAFEALDHAAELKTDMLIILNDNHISIDQSLGGLHRHLLHISTSGAYNRFKSRVWDSLGNGRVRRWLQKATMMTKMAATRGNGSVFQSLGLRYFGTIDGNDISQLVANLRNIKDLKGPKVLHVITRKGKGYTPAEKEQTIWHAPGKFDPSTGERVGSKSGADRFQDVFGQTLLDLAHENERIVGVTPAMATGCGMNLMMEALPERTFDVGIAEQHAVTFSAGLAAGGALPFCNLYSSFMQRAFDNIVHDAALQGLHLVICLDRAGLVGEDGATHHGAFDMSILRPIPGLTIASPMDEAQLRDMMFSATQEQWGLSVLRYPRGSGSGAKWRGAGFSYIEKGVARQMSEGSDTAVLSIGPVGVRVAEAVRRLTDEKGIRPLHFDMRFLKPIDEKAIDRACSLCRRIITVEDGSAKGGLHGEVAEYVAAKHPGVAVSALGIPDRFIHQGTPAEQYRECGLDVEAIMEAILK
ncbi:MAG: 1-deoxy-D-xylulose-5-phosphate synthase [Bacteroidales bacterium]|nr:1-deoxy-D-xylulose-5-phosphate synthase [Bacteroidales bacterium]